MGKATAEKIKGLGKTWGKARKTTKKDSGDFIQVEVGNYKMQLVKVTAGDFGGDRKLRLDFAVVESNDEEDIGLMNTMFEGYVNEDRAVWMQRLMTRCGMDVDELEIEEESDLVEAWEELIEEELVVAVKVIEKEGFTNLRINKKINDFDEDLTVDADDYKNGQPASDDDDDDDDPEFEVGQTVSFEKGKKTLEGEIKEFDDDDNAMVKVEGKKKLVKVDTDKLTLVEDDDDDDDDSDDGSEDSDNSDEDSDSESSDDSDDDDSDDSDSDDDSDEGDDDSDSDESNDDDSDESSDDDDNFDVSELKKGDAVQVKFDNEWFDGKVNKKPGKKVVSVKFDEDGEVEDIKHADIRKPTDEDEDGNSDSDDDGDSDTFEKGDEVIATIKGKEKKAKVVKVKGDEITVKTKKGDKKFVLTAEDLAHVSDED